MPYKHWNVLSLFLLLVPWIAAAQLQPTPPEILRGTSLPGTCTVGRVFFKTDEPAGHNLYGCTATNTWTLQGGTGTTGRVATTASLNATYANGASGVGGTLTNSGTLAALNIDGVTLASTNRVLVKNQAALFQNGLYTVTTVGSGAVAWVLTRATDYDTAAEVLQGTTIAIPEGTTNAGTLWIETGPGPFILGTTAIVFSPSGTAGGASVVNVRDFGATGDGVTDDTAAIQSALNLFGVATSRTGSVYIPLGEYKITQTLVYEGNPTFGIHIYGAVGGTYGPTGSRLVWAGASGGTMLYCLGMNGSTIDNLEFNGNGVAHTGLHIDATNADVPPGSAGSSNNVLRRLTIGGILGVDSAAIAFGHAAPAPSQVSEIDMENLVLVGDALGNSYYGIKTWEAGNTKNFKVRGAVISGFRYGVDWSKASGVFLAQGIILSNTVISDFRHGTGVLQLSSVESENSNTRFVVGTTGSNPGSLVIQGSSWEGAAPSDDYVIDYTGSITLIGNTFYNYRTGSSYPKVKVANVDMAFTNNYPASITSIGNYYMRAPSGEPAPIFDGLDNSIFSPTGSYAGKDISAMTIGDYGGVGGTIYHLRNRLPRDGLRSLSPVNPQTSSYAVTVADFGDNKTIPVATGTFTITLLPSGSQPPAWQFITIINSGSGVVTVGRNGLLINGAAADFTIPAGSPSAPNTAVFLSDGTNYIAMSLSNPIFTPGSLAFAGTSGFYTQDNANLFWNNTEKRLGLKTNAPAASLHINTLYNSADSIPFRLQNPASTSNDYADIAIGYPGHYDGNLIFQRNGIFSFGIDSNNNLFASDITLTKSLTLSSGSSGELVTSIYNTSAASSDHAKLALTTLYSTSGDPVISFNIATVGYQWNLGLDNSDSDKFKLSYGGSSVGTGDYLIVDTSGAVTLTGILSAAMGSSTQTMTNMGVANVQTSASGIGNAADTTDDTLFTYTLPLNSFSSNGKSLRMMATGHFATNGNTKQVKCWFAGAVIANSGAAATSNTDWICTIDITRIDATHVSAVGTFNGNGLTSQINVTANLAVADLTSNTSIVKITGASTVTGAANDVLGYQMRTEFMN